MTALNPNLLVSALDNAPRRLMLSEGTSLERRNCNFHRVLIDGANVGHGAADVRIWGEHSQMVDVENPANKDLLAVKHFNVAENWN